MSLTLERKLELLIQVIGVTYDLYNRCGVSDFVYFSQNDLSEDDVRFLEGIEREVVSF